MTTGSTFRDVRNRRLHSDRKKLEELVRNSHLIRLASTEGSPPEAYEIHFSCKGIIRVGPSGPVYGEHHRVHIEFPLEYPTRPPKIRWLTPLFHPNVNAEGTGVCISHWYPSKFLDDLCIMLGRMIQYKNYNPYSYLNADAAQWALEHNELLPVDCRSLRDGDIHGAEHEEFEIRLL